MWQNNSFSPKHDLPGFNGTSNPCLDKQSRILNVSLDKRKQVQTYQLRSFT